MNLATILARVQAIGARLRAARLGKLPPQPTPLTVRPLPGLRPPLGPWQGSKDLLDWFPWRFNCAGDVVYDGAPEQRRQWLTGDWDVEGTTTGRMRSSEPAESARPSRVFEGKFERVSLHDVDLSHIELRVLANMSDAERQAMLDNAPPGTHWMIEESSPVSPEAWRKLAPQRCPWDDWKPARDVW